MTETSNLTITHIRSVSSQPEVVANAGFEAIDNALAEDTDIDVPAENTYTMTGLEFRSGFFFVVDELVGSPATADLTVNVPAIKRGLFCVRNDTAFSVTVQISGQSETPPVVGPGRSVLMFCDGTDVRARALGAFPIGGSIEAPGTADVIFRYIFTESVTFPASLTGSVAEADQPPTADAECKFYKNGVLFGSVTFAAGSPGTPTFTAASAVQFDAGDILLGLAPNPADATLAGISITLLGAR